MTNSLTPVVDAETVNAENPWPGLLPFQEADKDFFKGRRPETEELLRLVLWERLTVLFGLSGLGKSSLLQAGLFPALREQGAYFPVYIRLNFAAPGLNLVRQVLEAISREAAAQTIEAPAARVKDTLWEYFHRQDANFWRRNRPIAPVLVFDQFEEIFTLEQTSHDRITATQAFIEELADLAEGRPPVVLRARLDEHPDEAEGFSFSRHSYKILIAIREDFLPELEALRPSMPAVALNRMRLRRMDGEAALLAVNQAPDLIDPPVAERVVRFVAASKDLNIPLASLEVDPALLSVVCRELNNKRTGRREPKITAGLLEGSRDAILEDFYQRSLVDAPQAIRVYVEEKLLTVNGRRNSDALDNALNTPGITRDAIDRLVQRRLLRIEDRGGGRLELTHDLLTGVVGASKKLRRELEKRRRRNRLVWAAFGLLVLLAAGGALFANYEAGQAREAALAKEVAQKTAANERALRGEADQEKQRAIDLEKEKDAALKRAEAALREADAARRNAVREEAAANQSADQERKAKLEADRQAGLAQDKAAEALANQQRANDEAKKASDAADNERKANAQVLQLQEKDLQVQQKSNAQADVVQAGYLAGANQSDLALAYLARALGRDAAAMAAKSFVLDLFMRGGVKIPPDFLPERSQAASFDHPPIPQPFGVFHASFSPDGLLVVTAGRDSVARLLDARDGHLIRELRGHRGIVNAAMFSADGSLVVTASQDGSAKIWDARSGAPKVTLEHKKANTNAPGGVQYFPVASAAFDHDGKRVVTASWDNTAVVWDAVTGRPTVPPLSHRGPVTSAAFSPDGSRVVTASWDKTAIVWNLASQKAEATLQLGSQVNAAAFSPNGEYIVTALEDTTAQVWEWQGARPLGATLRHGGPVTSAAFSPDGSRVVTASGDKTARVWEVETGAPIGLPLKHGKRINSAAFDREGLRIITASDDGTARIWEVRSEADDSKLLANLAEAVSGYRVADLPTPVLLPDRQKMLDDLRESARPALKRWLWPLAK